MGCVIFTNEPSDYEKGEVVYLGNRITEPPVREGVTYILEGSLTKEEAEMLASYIPYRMVVCCKTKPRFESSEDVLVAWKDKPKTNLYRLISGIKKYPQRLFIHQRLATAPIPYLLSALKGGVDNIHFWRLLAASNLTLPDTYTRSLFAYGIDNETQNIPVAKLAKDDEVLLDMRSSDKHIDTILQNDVAFANEVREKGRDMIPKGMKKNKVVDKWLM